MIYHLAYTNISARTRSGRSKKRSSWCAVGEGNNKSLSCEHTRNGLWVCACVLRALMLAESQDSACSHELDCTPPTAPCLGPWFKTPNAFRLQPVMMQVQLPPSGPRAQGRQTVACADASSPWLARESHDPPFRSARQRYHAPPPRGAVDACKPGAVGRAAGRGRRQSAVGVGGGEPWTALR